MPRMTTAEVIARGEYLQADFDPSTLTIAQLLGLLNYHDIQYPTRHHKDDLVRLFNTKIKTKSNQAEQGRLQRKKSQPGDSGNKVGVTDVSVNETREGRKAVPKDSGWEYNNVFQSGAPHVPFVQQSSSRPRISGAPPPSAKTRKPISPQHASKKGKDTELRKDQLGTKTREIPAGDTIDRQATIVSTSITRGRRVTRESHPPKGGPSLLVLFFIALLALFGAGVLYDYKHTSAQIGFCDAGMATNVILDDYRARSAAIDSCNRENKVISSSVDSTASVPSPGFASTQTASGEHSQWEYDVSAGLGVEVCPPPPFIPLSHLQTCTPCPRHAICTPSTMTCEHGYILYPHPWLHFIPVPGTPSLSSPFSTTSTTFIQPGNMSSPITDTPELIYFVIALVLDGMPGVGPIAFPPRCVEDPRRSLHISTLGEAVRVMLAAERGRRLCEGVPTSEPEGDEENEVKQWGVEIAKLREKLRDDLRSEAELVLALDDIFDEVIQQLVRAGSVFMGEDARGKQYIACKTSSMSWFCSIKVKVRDTWYKWKISIIGSILFIPCILAFRIRRAKKMAEKKRVAVLIQIVLDLLRNQEFSHHMDPVMVPQPYLSSLQLRDLVLEDEHSLSVRQRLWKYVEHVVEGNANIRTNLEEVEGGDELRVWRWVGSAGVSS